MRTFITLCHLLGVALTLGGAALTSFSALAQERMCQCYFSEEPWEAYGTHAACSGWTRNSGESCEIAFGGIGADPDLVAKVLQRNPPEYFEEVYSILITYLDLLRKNDMDGLTDPQFLRSALPIFMRAVFLRNQSEEIPLEELIELNQLIEGFVTNYNEPISQVFRGEVEPFEETFEGHKFEVGKGWIVLEHNGTVLATSYMPRVLNS